MLGEIGLNYQKDDFLHSVVETAVGNQLRDIKYRGRIPIEAGVTIYGIMNKAGVVNESEVYVATERGLDGERDCRISRNVIVTQSPAMHRGDVQVVNLVDVPADSPLKKLSNVFVLSQRIDSDLPSKPSGGDLDGDLDGDLYSVIWDDHLVPSKIAESTEYPRLPPVSLGRPVTAEDMSHFLVAFMEIDQLSMLCTIHMQLADQQPAGTFSPECIKLAQMASTAVDCSETGLPINTTECPQYDRRIRPDSMASSPQVIASDKGYLDIEGGEAGDDQAFAFEGLETQR